MQIIPVLDLKGGQAVHAVRGQRERYAPVQGVLARGGDALALATAYRDHLGCRTCYVADLDAISGGIANMNLLADLAGLGLTLWVDAGVSSGAAAWTLANLGVTRVIVGSESLGTVARIAALADEFPAERLVLSVDLRDDLLLGPADVSAPPELIEHAATAGIRSVILLDLQRVGAGAGPPLERLAALRRAFPGLEFYAGGGVRGRDDLDALERAGAAGALIATAFHRGVLTAADLQAYRGAAQ